MGLYIEGHVGVQRGLWGLYSHVWGYVRVRVFWA